MATRGRAIAPPKIATFSDTPRLVATTRAEAHEARRRAAEAGDYALAEHWYRCERALAAHEFDASRR